MNRYIEDVKKTRRAINQLIERAYEVLEVPYFSTDELEAYNKHLEICAYEFLSAIMILKKKVKVDLR